jgi:hypothetical protein
VRVGNARQSPRLETLSVAVEAGKSGVAAIVRESGAAVEGEILGLEQLKLPGALIYIVKPESLQLIVLNNHVREAVEALTCDATGRFKTPRLSPGDYAIVVEGYKPPTPDERLGSARRATYRAIGKLTVPAQGPAPRVRIRVPASLAGDGPDNAL